MPRLKRKATNPLQRRSARRRYKNRGQGRSQLSKYVRFGRIPTRYGCETAIANINIPIGSSAVYNAWYFTLGAHLPGYTRFTGLFDQYRLYSVTFKMRMLQPPEATGTTGNQQFYPDVYCTVDHDDNNVPTDTDYVRKYGKCKSGILVPNKWFTYKCHPTAAIQLYRTATTTSYAPAPMGIFLDLNQTDTPYYGIKTAVDASALTAQTSAWFFEVRAYLEWDFKNTR